MAQTEGRNVLVYLRPKGDSSNGWKPAHQTDGSLTKSRTIDTDETKDGEDVSPGALEITGSITARFDSEHDEKYQALDDSILHGDPIELWEVNHDTQGARYYEGYLSEVSDTYNVDGKLEIGYSYTLKYVGRGTSAAVHVRESEDGGKFIDIDEQPDDATV